MVATHWGVVSGEPQSRWVLRVGWAGEEAGIALDLTDQRGVPVRRGRRHAANRLELLQIGRRVPPGAVLSVKQFDGRPMQNNLAESESDGLA